MEQAGYRCMRSSRLPPFLPFQSVGTFRRRREPISARPSHDDEGHGCARTAKENGFERTTALGLARKICGEGTGPAINGRASLPPDLDAAGKVEPGRRHGSLDQ